MADLTTDVNKEELEEAYKGHSIFAVKTPGGAIRYKPMGTRLRGGLYPTLAEVKAEIDKHFQDSVAHTSDGFVQLGTSLADINRRARRMHHQTRDSDEGYGSAKYQQALVEFRKASAEFRKAQEAYRARTIGDTEFLAARKKFQAAKRKWTE